MRMMQAVATPLEDLANYGDCLNIEDLYAAKCRTPSDISPHLPYLRELADGCDTVVEFGVRHGYSTVAFLASTCRVVVSYDISRPQAVLPADSIGRWLFIQADTAKLDDIPVCDLLFIDTLHTAAQVREELRQAVYVRRYIVFHDTQTWGCQDEDGRLNVGGIVQSILTFLADNPAWRVKSHTPECNGLTVLERVTPA